MKKIVNKKKSLVLQILKIEGEDSVNHRYLRQHRVHHSLEADETTRWVKNKYGQDTDKSTFGGSVICDLSRKKNRVMI